MALNEKERYEEVWAIYGLWNNIKADPDAGLRVLIALSARLAGLPIDGYRTVKEEYMDRLFDWMTDDNEWPDEDYPGVLLEETKRAAGLGEMGGAMVDMLVNMEVFLLLLGNRNVTGKF